PEMVQANGAVQTAGAAQLSAIGAWLPTLSAGAGTTLDGHGADSSGGAGEGSGFAPGVTGNVSLSWDLFNGGRTLAQGHAAQAQADAASAGLVSQRAAVTLSVTRAFSDAERAQALLDVATSRIQQAQETLDAANKRAAVGNATKSDVLRAQLELNNAKEAQQQA